MICALCEDGLVGDGFIFDTAGEFLRRYEASRLIVPGEPVAANLCRVEPEKGYAIFGPAADALMVNAAIPTGMAARERLPAWPVSGAMRPLAVVSRMARAARASSAPGLYWPLLTTGRWQGPPPETGTITPAEFRARLYTLLAEGADGYFMRHDWQRAHDANPGLNEAIIAANREAAALAPWLSVGGMRGHAWTEEGYPLIEVSTRSAGDGGLLVFLVRKDAGAPMSAPHVHSAVCSQNMP